jgi:hypothetical protein
VIDFYNSTNGPFVPDTKADADTVVVFSDGVSGLFSLASFVANYQGSFPPAAAPVGSFVVENAGVIAYGGGSYTVLSAETPEPSTLLLVITGLGGFGLMSYRRQAGVRP